MWVACMCTRFALAKSRGVASARWLRLLTSGPWKPRQVFVSADTVGEVSHLPSPMCLRGTHGFNVSAQDR
jgi:hypothetical protein